MSKTYTVTVPVHFWNDHMERECTPALKETSRGRRVELVLDQQGLDDLSSDADYYSDGQGFDTEWLRYGGLAIIRSARATVKALKEAGL